MGYSNWGTDYKTKIPKIANGGDYIITAITPETKQIVPGMEHQGYRVTIENLIDKKAKPVHTFILSENNSMEKLKAIGDEYERLRQEAMSLPKGSQAARQAWIALSNFGESFIAKFDVTDSKGYTKVSRGIDYGYAHTIHKSQGGTYKYIFVNDKDIESTFSKDKDIRQQSKYVGITRAETKAVVLTNFDKNQSYEEEVSKEVYENSPTKTLNDLFADESRKAKDEYTTDDYDTWALYAKERQQDEDEMLEDQEFRKAYEEYLIMCKKK